LCLEPGGTLGRRGGRERDRERERESDGERGREWREEEEEERGGTETAFHPAAVRAY